MCRHRKWGCGRTRDCCPWQNHLAIERIAHEGQTKPGLISGRHRQTPRQLQEPRYQQPERRPRSFLQPCRPSSCSFWACSRQCHPPAVSKGAHEHSHDRWKQGRWNPGRDRRKVLLDGGQLQVQRARECLREYP
ncbi:PDZK1-interacting protein 1 isoform X2 [Leopardus geoffroyi]|uniref:PDZK1-interacting protein 1 isoform X2 n=1 Tax=Leopardus geoffroyi TaxID=46844 RepID=UPI001E25EAA1|nr:PDZK1-interacting protein 1 isoform X2 [Leopardus geoffroyi]